MEFREATQEDMAFVRQNPFEDAVKGYPYMEVPEDNCYVGTHESRILALFGVQIRWDGVGMFYLLLTKDFKNYITGTTAILKIRRKIDELIKDNDLFRAEAYIRVEFTEAIEMIKVLGFKKEGTMEQFFPDKTNAYLYARTM